MNVHPDLMPLVRPLDELTPDPRNARTHDERNVDAIAASYRDHGQRKPIVAQRKPDGRLVVRAGNGQLEAARKLGWDGIAVVVVDESDKDALAFALRDNRTAELATWDLEALGSSLRDATDVGWDVGDLGWEPFEAEPLMHADWTPAPPVEAEESFVLPDRRVSLMFTREQWEELKSLLGEKPTAEEVLARCLAARVYEQHS